MPEESASMMIDKFGYKDAPGSEQEK